MVLIASVAAEKGNIELYERKKIIMIMMSIKSKNESIAMVIATAMRFDKKMLICLIFCFFLLYFWFRTVVSFFFPLFPFSPRLKLFEILPRVRRNAGNSVQIFVWDIHPREVTK